MKLNKRLMVELKDEEKLEITQKFADLLHENEKHEADKKRYSDHYGSKIKENNAEIKRLADLIQDGEEERTVLCEVHFDEPEEGKKTIIRLDTNEVVEVVPMSPEEMQRDLFGGDENLADQLRADYGFVPNELPNFETMATPEAADEDTRNLLGDEFIIVSCTGGDEDPEIVAMPNMKFHETYDEDFHRYYFVPLPKDEDLETKINVPYDPESEEIDESDVIDDSYEVVEDESENELKEAS